METYSYHDPSDDNENNESELMDRLQSHLKILIGQAVVLVLLAIVFIGYEARTLQLEAQVQTPTSPVQETEGDFLAEAEQEADVLGAENEEIQFTSPIADEIAEPTPTPFNDLPQESYSIALFGDSMVDTMNDGELLRDALEEKYPGTQFVIFNYGRGAMTVTEAFDYIYEPLEHNDRRYRSVDRINPDVIIVGSFGYNIYSPVDRNHHWLEYTRFIQEVQTITPNVYMLAEIAPRRSGFGLGAEGVIWEPHNAWVHTGHIIDQIKNVIGLSEALDVPVINTYTDSLEPDREEGRRELIDTSDNIHPSEEGHEFMADIIAEEIDFAELE